MGLDISRVHLHPYGSFFMCYDTNKWHDAKDAILKSSLAVPKYCLNPYNDELKDMRNFEIASDLPKSFNHPNRKGEMIHVNKGQLLYDFDLSDEVHCYL